MNDTSNIRTYITTNAMTNDNTTDTVASPAQSAWGILFVCWLLTAVATLGSLFFSRIMGLEPCVLCWYQRIFMFPLAVILLVGLFRPERAVLYYALPLAIIGWGFAFYHQLLYVGYIPENLQPCSEGVSCAEVNLELFGFITIPLLSLLAFTIIIMLLLLFRNRTHKQ